MLASALRRTAPLLLLFALGASAGEGEALQKIEREFQQAISKVTPATVVCVPAGVAKDTPIPGSSGVIVSKKGLVLSDGDVGTYLERVGRDVRPVRADKIEVRVPDLKRGGYAAYAAHVVRRLRDLDSTLLRIDNPPSSGFPGYLPPGSSDGLQVGDFSFAMGNAFGMADESPPALTAGIIATLAMFTPSVDPKARDQGRIESIYTSAAVNQGVNGGPLVDVEGRLVATISGKVEADLAHHADPQILLGKAVPMDRLRAAYADLPESAELFEEAKPARERSKEAATLESVFHAAGVRAHPIVVSLTVKRTAPISIATPQGGAPIIRYDGPVSAILLSRSGEIVTSLYNLTSIATLEAPPGLWERPPPDATVEAGLKAIESITVNLPDGRDLAAHVAGYDPRLGVALVQADVPPAKEGEPVYALPEPVPSPPETLQEGRFVLALGNPFGAARRTDPLMTMGILSKHHAEDASARWRGDWQTDAGATDGNCGGAVVDLQGRVLGMLTIWSPSRHGRNSGIAFVVPLPSILAALPDIRAGKVPVRGQLGIRWPQSSTAVALPRIDAVEPDSPAAAAGIKAGDVLTAVNGEPVTFIAEALDHLVFRWAGDTVRLTVERTESGHSESKDFEVTLAPRK